MNRSSRLLASAVAALTLGAAAILFVEHVRAAGAPATNAFAYSGTLTLPDGSAVQGSKNIGLAVYTSQTATTPTCQVISAPVPVSAGHFQIALPDTCIAAAKASPDLWVDVQVDGASVGKTKLGAIPYAVEASHAVQADSAANATNAANAAKAPWSGITGVPISIQASTGSIQLGGSNRTLTAGNEAGNLHIDSLAAGWIYLNRYSGKGTIFGNGNDGDVGSIDAAGNLNIAGSYSGRAGTRGGRILDRNGDNAISFEWTGSALQFYSEDVNVKNFIIDHPVEPSRYLVHTTLEGPENAVFYRGSARLQRGVAEVSLPSYFEAAVESEGRTIQLTPRFADLSEPISGVAASSIHNGKFVVRAVDGHNPSQAFDWEVKGVRKDVPPLMVEPLRTEIEVRGEGPYKYYRKLK